MRGCIYEALQRLQFDMDREAYERVKHSRGGIMCYALEEEVSRCVWGPILAAMEQEAAKRRR